MQEMIENIQAIGIYDDEIKIISKNELPRNYSRKYYDIDIRNNKKIYDESAANERRIVVTFESNRNIVCRVEESTIICDYEEYI